jgi:hypothetical protein
MNLDFFSRGMGELAVEKRKIRKIKYKVPSIRDLLDILGDKTLSQLDMEKLVFRMKICLRRA